MCNKKSQIQRYRINKYIQGKYKKYKMESRFYFKLTLHFDFELISNHLYHTHPHSQSGSRNHMRSGEGNAGKH